MAGVAPVGVGQGVFGHQGEFFHDFIDFKKAFDGVWHDIIFGES